MNYKKTALWAWTIKNSIDIICFTALAMFFQKWWIVLFAALFISSLRMSKEEQNEKQAD